MVAITRLEGRVSELETENQQLREQARLAFSATFDADLAGVGERLAGLGVSAGFISALTRKLRLTHGQLPDEVPEKLTRAELQRLVDQKLRLAIESITPADIAVAGLKDKATLVGILFDKRALLRGEPTSITGSAERREIRDLMAKLLAEGARRGLTIEGVAREVRGELVAVGDGKAG